MEPEYPADRSAIWSCTPIVHTAIENIAYFTLLINLCSGSTQLSLVNTIRLQRKKLNSFVYSSTLNIKYIKRLYEMSP